jgi:Radical SAM superfamily/Iron-sulfur cluster-binding domain
MSLNYLATRFSCTWPWSTLVMLCDGRMVCGCADPYGHRVLGDARASGVSAIWTGNTLSALRGDLNSGGSRFCGDCPLKVPLKRDQEVTARPLDAGPLPSRMYIECTAACNISCTEACCAPETGITKTRQAGMLDFELFTRVVDEAGPSLVRIDFFNYGEAFLHKRAIEMCEYIKSRFPNIYLYTSTNGLMFNDASARRLVHSGIDEVTFSIDGATPASYLKYRQRGDFDLAIRNLRTMADEKRRNGLDLPVLNWRYILFNWNDSDEEMNGARALAEEIGIDRLSWEITDHPENAYSRRF